MITVCALPMADSPALPADRGHGPLLQGNSCNGKKEIPRHCAAVQAVRKHLIRRPPFTSAQAGYLFRTARRHKDSPCNAF